jgi:hypothetical protein
VPAGNHVCFDAEPVTGDPALQTDRAEAVVLSTRTRIPIAGHAVNGTWVRMVMTAHTN